MLNKEVLHQGPILLKERQKQKNIIAARDACNIAFPHENGLLSH